MENEHLKLNELSAQELAAHVTDALATRNEPLSPHQAVICEAAKRFVEQTAKPRRVVIISPDKDTDYCYVDMPKAEALAAFLAGDDGALYDPATLKITESFFRPGFMLWRNMGNNMADLLGQRGLPDELANLLRRPEAPNA